MRVAVIHHRCRDDVALDSVALAESIGSACAHGAAVVVCPRIPVLAGMPPHERKHLLQTVQECAGGTALLMPFTHADNSEHRIAVTPLGLTSLAAGDVCLNPDTARMAREAGVHAVVWRPGAESELQAEAIIEYVLRCAPALAGLVVLAECTGSSAHLGQSGTSAIVLFGELVAESAGAEDEILYAEVEGAWEASEQDLALPELPPLLAQRLAVHEGRRASVEYPWDLS
ncbi:MAG: hypothetical protein KGZ40_07275 [Clostridiales bacterium]|nr:hypothetical protein [Clostridiales bacterium]